MILPKMNRVTVLFLCSTYLCAANDLVGKSVGESVDSLHLMSEKITVAEILENHEHYFSNTSQSNFDGNILGYVTPWNSLGYDVVKTFGKFSLVSPVWLQVRPMSNNDYSITGTHDIDKNWVLDVKKANKLKKVKVVPRVLFEGFSMDTYRKLFSSLSLRKKLSSRIVECLQQHKLDGAVLEVWSQLGGSFSDHMAELVSTVTRMLRKHGLVSVLVIPPPVYQGGTKGYFTGDDFATLRHSVDFFSLMTYDYSSPQRPGPNSPLDWIQQCIELLAPSIEERANILMGLNFYGYDFTAQGGSAVLGRDFISHLRSSTSVQPHWDESSQEHFFDIKTGSHKHVVFFPTLLSVWCRLRLAERLGVGVAIWEVGQGLNYFYDLL